MPGRLENTQFAGIVDNVENVDKNVCKFCETTHKPVFSGSFLKVRFPQLHKKYPQILAPKRGEKFVDIVDN